MSKQHDHSDGKKNCQCQLATGSVGQTLTEMDFERGIWTAAIYNETIRIKDFIRKGDTDKRDNSGYTALHYAARNGNEEICQLLIAACTDINATTKGGATPLHRAAMMGHYHIVKLLISSKAKVDIQDEDGQTALHRSASKGFVNVSKDLLNCFDGLKLIKDKKNRIPFDLVPNDNKELKQLLMIVNYSD